MTFFIPSPPTHCNFSKLLICQQREWPHNCIPVPLKHPQESQQFLVDSAFSSCLLFSALVYIEKEAEESLLLCSHWRIIIWPLAFCSKSIALYRDHPQNQDKSSQVNGAVAGGTTDSERHKYHPNQASAEMSWFLLFSLFYSFSFLRKILILLRFTSA